jgi:hypothetical protein
MDWTGRTTLTSAEAPANDPATEAEETGWRSTLLPPPPSQLEDPADVEAHSQVEVLCQIQVQSPLPDNDRLPYWEDTWQGIDDAYSEEERPTLRRVTPAPLTWRSRSA